MAALIDNSATTTKSSPSRNWCFTLNNPLFLNNNNRNYLFEQLIDARYAVYQIERGEQGTLHAQGYIELSKPKRLAAMKAMLPGAHFEVRRGTREQARDYCMKADTRIEGPFEHGTWTAGGSGARNDLSALKRRLDEQVSLEVIADEFFGEFLKYERGINAYKRLKNPKRNWKTKVIVLVGDTGAGKSHYCHTNYPDAYWKQNSKWFCGYDSHDTVVLDDFYGWLPWSTLLNICDQYQLTVETKGGNVNFVAKNLIITSNADPNTWYDHTNSHMSWAALERRVDLWIGAKVIEGRRILKEFKTYQEFKNWTFFTDLSELPAIRELPPDSYNHFPLENVTDTNND